MILAVDPGSAKCGWAVVRPRTGAVLELGTLTSEPDKRANKSTDRARRASLQASALTAIAGKHACTMIAAEAVSVSPGPARFSMAVSLNLSWGVLCGVACVLGVELVEVTPKQWQHAIVPECDGAIDYEVVFAKLSQYVERHAALQLAGIAKSKQNHALDAVAVGLYAALRPKLTRIATGRT